MGFGGGQCWFMPPEGAIRGPSLSILRYYMASFLLWIYFIWVWFYFSMQIFQPPQCSACCSWHISAKLRCRPILRNLPFSLTHMQKMMTCSIKLHFTYKTEQFESSSHLLCLPEKSIGWFEHSMTLVFFLRLKWTTEKKKIKKSVHEREKRSLLLFRLQQS